MSGHFICSAGVTKHDMVILLDVDGEQFPLETCLHTNGGYGYPYSVRKEFVVSQPTKLKVTMEHKQNQTFNLSTNIISISSMIALN